MKRTKEAYFRPNPSPTETQYCSGLTFVIGEDQDYHIRTKQFQQQQRENLLQQMEEKKTVNKLTKEMNDLHDQQLLTTTQHRGELELEKQKRMIEMERAHDQYNLQQRKRREQLAHEEELAEERREVELLNLRKVKAYRK